MNRFTIRSRRLLIPFAGIAWALASAWVACIQPEPNVTPPPPAPVAVPHRPARIVDVIPDAAPQKLAQAKALAKGVIQTLEPGDQIIVVTRSDFSLVTSQVVPGERLDPSEVQRCAEVAIGGASPRCQEVASARQQLQAWRAGALQLVDSIPPKSPTGQAVDDCRLDSGWPYEAVLQLLFAFQDETNTRPLNRLILGGGDADARGDAPRLPTEYVAHVEIIAAPYTMACGNPGNLIDWFRDAAAVRWFSAERPASAFPAFLFQASPAAYAGSAR